MMTEPMLQSGARVGHRGLLLVWRYLPLLLRRLAIRVLYPAKPVGAIAIIQDDDGRVLLVRQTYHREGASWGVPGGWLTFGETPVQAAVRETFEETGLQVEASRVLTVGGGPYGEISVAYECHVVGDTRLPRQRRDRPDRLLRSHSAAADDLRNAPNAPSGAPSSGSLDRKVRRRREGRLTRASR